VGSSILLARVANQLDSSDNEGEANGADSDDDDDDGGMGDQSALLNSFNPKNRHGLLSPAKSKESDVVLPTTPRRLRLDADEEDRTSSSATAAAAAAAGEKAGKHLFSLSKRKAVKKDRFDNGDDGNNDHCEVFLKNNFFPETIN
jgi:hypothetical protein